MVRTLAPAEVRTMAINTHPDAQWFDDAGLGLFVHWGLSAVDATVEISWGMVQDKPWGDDSAIDGLPSGSLTPEEYFGLAEEFDPEGYDPDRWLAAARKAGMEYAVLTTKHHDGFALWPSEYGDFSTRQYLDGRDLVGEFVDACRRQGLKVGFYFSLPDWHHPDFPRPESYDDLDELIPEYRVGSEHRHVDDNLVSREGPPVEDTGELVRFERFFKYAKGQLRELVTRYGHVDLIWFDNPLWRESLDHRHGELFSMLRAEQPHIVINGRTGYTTYGDYLTPERKVPDRPLEGWWELAQTWGNSWGYTEGDEYRDLDWTLELVSKTVGRGGNILLNVGPTADGDLTDEMYERLADLATWMRHSGHTVKGVDRGPWPERANTPLTRREGVWYVHFLAGEDEVTVRDVPEPVDVRLVRTGETLSYGYRDDDLSLSITPSHRDSPDEVVALSWPRSHHHLL
jgi:alpha-L-fucosidase